ncbi:MAG: histidine--tRNA ligase [Bosea sp.]|nr:histidine--tRNA ligase [Bosea sp. (in: a-proteobacteria)]
MSKTDKLKARRPRGLEDRNAADAAATDRMLAKIKERFELFGFEPVETPFIEYTDALGKFLPDQDRPNEGVFSFQDDDEQWLSLRYDLTAPLARYVAENFDALPKPYRSYRSGYVFRNEKPGPGRFRQFMQFDADIVGASSVAADAEACMLMADTLEAVGIKRGDYVIKVNNRKVLDGVMEAIGLGGEENAGRRLGVLRAIDKKDKIGLDGVQMLLGSEGRKDESGDFTRGVGLKISQVDDIVSYLIHPDWLPSSDLYAQGIGEMMELEEICRQGGYNTDRILVARDVVRGLEYYTGPVFEAELTFPVTNEDGQVVRFGSVAGGGRYDGLVGRFRNDPVPATGFSIGVSRLYTALKLTNSPLLAGMAKPGPVVVTVMDKDRVSDYQRMVSELRGAGIAAELYLGSSGFNAQMKYADKRRSPCVVIQGTDEKAAGTVQVKDLILGAELAKLGREGKDREDYLERQKDAQFAVPEQRLVEAVKQVLARHG